MIQCPPIAEKYGYSSGRSPPPPLSSSMMDTLFYSHYFIAKKEGVKGKFVNGFEYLGQYFLLFSDDTARDHFLLFSFRSHVLIVFALFVYN